MQVILLNPLQIRILLGKEDDLLLDHIEEVTHLSNKSAGEDLTLEMLWSRLEILTGARANPDFV